MDRCQAPPRHRFLTAAIMIVLAVSGAGPALADDVSASRSEIIRGLLPTVVNISVRKPDAVSVPTSAPTVDAAIPEPTASSNLKTYIGSGFVIDPSGLIVTNYHVVQDSVEITVVFSDGARLAGRITGASRLADLALVKVAANHSLAAAHWGDSDRLQVGDQVLAAGDPFGIGLSVSAGIVSGLNRDIQDSPYDDFIQTDATINHGNSGGPLFDMQGNVIGVDSDIISPTSGSSGVGFAIPSRNARFVVDRLRKYGWVRPGWIGVKVQTITPEMAEAMGMAQPEGSLVAWVLPDGPAKKAGLAIGDVILRYDGSTPSDDRALLRDIVTTTVGDTATLLVRHDGEEHNVSIVVDAWPRDQWDAQDAPMLAQRPKIIIPPNLGLSLSALTSDAAAKLGLENGLKGVLVSDVAANSDPAHRGMVSGDVILRVQDQPVATPAEAQSRIEAARASKRAFVLMLVLPKVRNVKGPKWVAVQTGAAGG
ncbi:trypsin-like peptidase domain-containing protein [Rhodopila sp.]|uniref:trypsin-like peptidase domain-containing protein n=1 Tax=Rhodopila sp. TaxID=2480087 RepID=UPI003D0E047D